MTKERLEELIKQRATIWSSGFNEEIKLTPKNCKIEKQKWLTEPKPKLYLVVKEDEEHYPTYCLDYLREDVDRVKWHLKNDATRIERFEPPMWEDIEEYFNCIDYKFAFVKNNEIYSFTVGKNGAVDISKLFIYGLGFHPIYTADATKENYEKACEIVRDLFKGEK